jgi:hypothetical protein
MSQNGGSQCFEVTLLPGIDSGEFEKFMKAEMVPGLKALQDRKLTATANTLLKAEQSDSDPRYIWLVFVSLLNGAPELANDFYFSLATASNLLSKFATVRLFSEVVSGSSQ